MNLHAEAPEPDLTPAPVALRRFGRIAEVLPAAVALTLGTSLAIALRDRVLDPDVLEFEAIARNMSLATVIGGAREPLWPVLFILPVRLLGDQSALAIRLIGVLAFVFMVVVFQHLVRELFGRRWSIVAALLMAATPWLLYQAVRGLREQTAAALVMLLVLAILPPKVTGRRIVILFALAGITGLLRWDAMVVMLPVLGLTLLIRRPRPLVWIAGPAVVALLVGPLLLVNYVDYGDAFVHSNIHARFYRNVEFHDQPGFVTSAQMKISSFSGPPITWTQYVFGLHSNAELARRAVTSFATIPLRLISEAIFISKAQYLFPSAVAAILQAVAPFVSVVIWLAAVVGGLSLLRSRAWAVPVILGETILLYSPIANLIEYRLVLTALPLLGICVLQAIRISEMGLALIPHRLVRADPATSRGGLKAERQVRSHR